jgi:hypothetical protein
MKIQIQQNNVIPLGNGQKKRMREKPWFQIQCHGGTNEALKPMRKLNMGTKTQTRC